MLSRDELEALTLEEQVEYMRLLLDHVRAQIADTKRQIEARDEELEKRDSD